MFARIAAVVNKSSDMERCPTGQSEQEGLANESPSDVTGVEVAPHQRNRHKVDNERHNWTNNHFVIDFVDFRVNVENLANDQGAESNGDDVGVAFWEPHHWA